MKATIFLLAIALFSATFPANASPELLVDADTGDILHAKEATSSWHPASLTKLMTAHLALSALRRGEIGMNTPVVFSARAAAEPPSKLGLPAGHALRLEDALRVMLVRSMNDVAFAIAETISGSHGAFVEAMNAEAARLGMSGTMFMNANGLHDVRQVTTARDMAVLALTIMRLHQDRFDLFGTPFVTINGRRLKNTNELLGSYPGVDGMKTGYLCASGFNLVTSAYRNGRRLVGVVLGSPGARQRGEVSRVLLDHGFSVDAVPIGNLRSVRASAPVQAPDLRPFSCGKMGKDIPARDGEFRKLDTKVGNDRDGNGALSGKGAGRPLVPAPSPSRVPPKATARF